ncbi:MAG TPA: GNAT family N-acetyltransferase [Rhizomicrobium sp.]|jgi:RimJ/RimL family protein N-acetyltransferase|nr:GNAT family N-acetyltransferase [Rhizomicrobium sp.]
MITPAPAMNEELETERLLLRPVSADDLPRIAALMADYDVAKNLSTAPHPYALADAEAFYAKHSESCARGESHVFALGRKNDGAFIGKNGLHATDGVVEMGYWLGKPYWGQGFGTEAARRVLEFGFNDLKLEKIVAGCFEDNPASGRILSKLGFTATETIERNCLARGQTVRCNMMVLTRDAFQRKQAA